MRFRVVLCSVASAGLLLSGCKEEADGVPRPPGSAPASKSGSSGAPSRSASGGNPHAGNPHAGNPHAGMGSASAPAEVKAMGDVDVSGVKFVEESVVLSGITLSVPEGWVKETPTVNARMPSATAKAQFRLPKADNEAEDAVASITHFPGMKGMDEANLTRWYGQFSQPDGGPTTAVATKALYDLGAVTVTLADIPGTMRSGGAMMGGGSEKKDYRMLAAIIDHKDGPHFLKLTGPSSCVERWKASAVAFLKSAKVNP